MNDLNLLATIACILFSFLPIWIGVSSMKDFLSCTEEIKAEFQSVKTHRYSHTSRTCSTFKYFYNDSNFLSSTLENTSLKEEKNFVPGFSYTIYINPKNPNICKHRKKSIYLVDIFMISFGIFLIISTILTFIF